MRKAYQFFFFIILRLAVSTPAQPVINFKRDVREAGSAGSADIPFVRKHNLSICF